MNIRFARRFAVSLGVSAAISCLPLVAIAQGTTRIEFAPNSYCGSYSGDFSGGREFVLWLSGGQTFTSRNIGSGTQYDVYLYGPDGEISGQRVASDEISYRTRQSGDHYIYIQSSNQYGAVEFCAY